MNEDKQLTPEAAQMINEMCDQTALSGQITHLGNAEEALQRAAYENEDYSYMYRFAYELKQMREQLEKIEAILGYEPDRE